jgi:hypothetical protein
MTETAHDRPMTDAVWQRAELLAEMMDRLGCRAIALRLDRGAAFANASRRCLACPYPSRCRLWLEQRGHGSATPPAFCGNAAFLVSASADEVEKH